MICVCNVYARKIACALNDAAFTSFVALIIVSDADTAIFAKTKDQKSHTTY